MWIVNLGLYKNVVRTDGYRVEFRATLDNAFNHPQFVVIPSSSMLDITPFLIDGLRENGVMNVVSNNSGEPGGLLARPADHARSASDVLRRSRC